MAGRWVAAGVVTAVLAVVGTTLLMTSRDSGGSAASAGSAGDAGAGRHGDNGAPPVAGGGSGSPPGGSEPSGVAPRDQGPSRDLRLTLPVQSFELLAPDRLELRYTTGLPECQGRLQRAVVKEDDEEVVVMLVLHPPTVPAGHPCPEVALVEDAVVDLAAPLDGRRVIDGSTGRRVHRGHHDLY